MTAHPYDDIDVFALGALDADAAARVLEHADSCSTCAVLVAEAMRAASSLEPEGERPVKLSNVGARLQSRPLRQPAPWYGWAASVAAAAAIALLVWNVNLRSNRLNVPVAFLVHSHFQHHELRGGAGSAKVIQALDGSWVYVVGDGLVPRSRYFVWETVAGNQHEIGSFTSNPRGQVAAFFQQQPVKVQGFALSGSPGPPQGAGVLRWP